MDEYDEGDYVYDADRFTYVGAWGGGDDEEHGIVHTPDDDAWSSLDVEDTSRPETPDEDDDPSLYVVEDDPHPDDNGEAAEKQRQELLDFFNLNLF